MAINPTTAPVSTLGAQIPFSYDHVPTLEELLPATGGIPGVTYAQVCAKNVHAAQTAEWDSVHGAKAYEIVGPDGRNTAMVLACKGTPVRGMDARSGRRMMFLDQDVFRLTGMWLPPHIMGFPPELMEEFNLTAEMQPATPTVPEHFSQSVPLPAESDEVGRSLGEAEHLLVGEAGDPKERSDAGDVPVSSPLSVFSPAVVVDTETISEPTATVEGMAPTNLGGGS